MADQVAKCRAGGLPAAPGRAGSDVMKKIEAIIKPFKLEDVKEALSEVGIAA